MPLKRDNESTTPEQQSMLGIDLFCIQGTATLISAPRHVSPSSRSKGGIVVLFVHNIYVIQNQDRFTRDSAAPCNT